jgi:hypothetical protein
MKVVVVGYEGDEPIYNTRFLAFATHYGYRPWACRRRRPQTKGKVERPFLFVEQNLLNGRSFRSLDHLNEVTAWWLVNVADVRTHRETNRRPVDLHAEELPHLLTLPDKPYDAAEVVYRRVNVEGFVSYRQNHYSVPWRYISQALPLRITEDQVLIYGRNLEQIAAHPLYPRTVIGQRSEQKQHRPRLDPGKKHEILSQRFGELGEAGQRFLDGLVRARRCGKDEAHKVLALLGSYHRADLIKALERAVQFGAFSLRAIERILAATAEPKTALQSLIESESQRLDARLKDRPVHVRPTAEYQHLLFQEPPHHGQESATGPEPCEKSGPEEPAGSS